MRSSYFVGAQRRSGDHHGGTRSRRSRWGYPPSSRLRRGAAREGLVEGHQQDEAVVHRHHRQREPPAERSAWTSAPGILGWVEIFLTRSSSLSPRKGQAPTGRRGDPRRSATGADAELMRRLTRAGSRTVRGHASRYVPPAGSPPRRLALVCALAVSTRAPVALLDGVGSALSRDHVDAGQASGRDLRRPGCAQPWRGAITPLACWASASIAGIATAAAWMRRSR